MKPQLSCTLHVYSILHAEKVSEELVTLSFLLKRDHHKERWDKSLLMLEDDGLSLQLSPADAIMPQNDRCFVKFTSKILPVRFCLIR